QTSMVASGQTVRANFGATLDLVAEILRQPSFPATELETLKRASVADIEEGRSDPRSLALRAINRYDNPYPPGDDRYTPTIDEEIGELQGQDVAALKRFYSEFYGASAAEIGGVGDFDPAEVKSQLERLFGTWSAQSPFAR